MRTEAKVFAGVVMLGILACGLLVYAYLGTQGVVPNILPCGDEEVSEIVASLKTDEWHIGERSATRLSDGKSLTIYLGNPAAIEIFNPNPVRQKQLSLGCRIALREAIDERSKPAQAPRGGY